MDFDDFDDASADDLQVLRGDADDVHDALMYFDQMWYIPRSRVARRMDLLGDYAGNEFFIIDGESLFQTVLDDPLLALGRRDDCSFQILHAYHTLERLLAEYTTRAANFEVVFFHENRHLTICTGEDTFIVASRMLARTMLFKHLLKLDITVHTFQSLNDKHWKAYESLKKPMFILANDGGVADRELAMSPNRVLSQRKFLYDVLRGTVALALLKGTTYADSKIITFVYEPVRQGAREQFPQGALRLFARVHSKLNQLANGYVEHSGDVLSKSGELPAPDDVNDCRSGFIAKLTQDILAKMGASSGSATATSTLALVHIMHYYHLPTLRTQDRAQPSIPLEPTVAGKLCTDFVAPLFFTLVSHLSSQDYRHLDYDFDGRIFLATAIYVSRQAEALSLEGTFSPKLAPQILRKWQDAKAYASPPSPLGSLGTQLRDLSVWLGRPTLPGDSQGSSAGQGSRAVARRAAGHSVQLLPFDNPVLNKHLPSVLRTTGSPTSPTGPSAYMHFGAGEGTMFSDTRHWHNQKSILPPHLGGEKAKPRQLPKSGGAKIWGKYTVKEWMEMKRLKRHQQFMSNLQIQAATITGASGGILRQMVIPSVGVLVGGGRNTAVKTQTGKPAKPTASSHVKGGGGSKKKEKAVKLTSKQLLLQKIQDEKSNSANDTSRAWWKERLGVLSDMALDTQVQELANLFRNPRAGEEATRLEMELYEVNLEVQRWTQASNPGSDEVRDRHTLPIMRTIKRMVDRKVLTTAGKEAVTTILTLFGFERYIDGMMEGVRVVECAPSFKFKKLVKSKGGERVPVYEYMVGVEDAVEWQLRLFGEYMDRSMDSAYDRRVEFQPDAWQRKVLDCIDDNHSILVVAPTSAGKTFISFYAMEQVLRSSDDEILVYVAPTKALVTQITAEIYARFSKKMDARTCWAIHTRDWRINDPQKCQILVTVPEVLAIMLLSPPLATVWTPKIKRIILDEIHTIGHQEGGAVWEQILLLAPCPIIGLSATIGSPEIFNDWLAKVQEAHGFKHTFVRHPHRYSHLRKFFYVIKDDEEEREFVSLAQHKSTERTRFVHPISALTFGRATIPDDLALEAKDTLTLYRAFEAVAAKRGLSSDVLDMLDPKVFFSGRKILLRQKDVLEYEAQLKTVIAGLLAGSGPFQALPPSDASGVGLEVVSEIQDPVLKRLSSSLDVTPSRDTFRRNLIHLLADLHVRNELPAILFNYDRTGCEFIGKAVGRCLEAAEERYKETSPAWKRKVEQWEVWKAGAKERAARLENKQKKRKGKDDAEQGNAEDPTTSTWTWEQSFDPGQVLPEFSFTNHKSSYALSELEQDIGKLSWGGQVPSWLFALLRRGIGVHHSGMNKGYRSLVEALFRRGFLRVVVATGTLALGINAPAKTTVFCADSPFLTALEFRQCAGRAGRRGYDLLGNVVFYGFPMDRVQRLLLSKLPVLGGGFPLTSTLVLRLCNLLEESNRAPNVVKAIDTLMSMPRISFASNVGHDYLVHHVQFSIEYLRRNGLLNEEGKPMNLFAIAGHLYYTEPSNLALVGLLRAGVLHSICKAIPTRATDTDVKIDEAKKAYILLMAHLFNRRVLPRSLSENEEALGRLTSKYPSKIVLPPLPPAAQKALQRQANDILEVFVGYARAYSASQSHSDAEVPSMPLSGTRLAPGTGDNGQGGGTLTDFLRKTSVPTTVRSAYVANSGLGDDDFTTVQELADTVRAGVHLNPHAIPCFDAIISSGAFPERGQAPNTTVTESRKAAPSKLNAYLLDFYVHGQVDTLVNANGIRRGDIWYLIEDFRLVLLTVKAALEQLLIKASAAKASAKSANLRSQVGASQRSNWRKKPQTFAEGTGDWDDSDDDDSSEEDSDTEMTMDQDGSVGFGSLDDTLVDVEDALDGAELDGDDDDEGVKVDFKRPPGVTNQDWMVYRVVSLACGEFDVKARAMWA